MRRPIDPIARPFLLFIAVAAAACGGKVIGDHRTNTNDSAPSTPPSFEPTPPSTPPSSPAPGSDACGVSFVRDVLSKMTQWQCTNSSCHGGTTPINLPRIDAASPSDTHASLVAFVMSDGRPYVVPSSADPRDSGIVCNLGGACGVRMPLGSRATNEEIALVEEWLACGAPDN